MMAMSIPDLLDANCISRVVMEVCKEPLSVDLKTTVHVFEIKIQCKLKSKHRALRPQSLSL